MTEQDKELLLKDLCARLPYGVILQVPTSINGDTMNRKLLEIGITTDDATVVYVNNDGKKYGGYSVSDVIPYLRPMSSMTEEEKKDLKKEHLKDEKLYAECLTNTANGDSSMRGKVIPHFAADWCNKYGFDYRGLVPMGLALEAPEGMYKK